jgi:IgA Peptidase M64
MGIGDGTVLGKTKIVDNGSPAARWNLALVGDGYRATELGQYANDAQNFVNALFAAAPFSDSIGFVPLHSAINVYRIDVSSTDSGADDPSACGGTGATAATYFDAAFCNGGIRRLLEVNNTTVINVANAQVPEWHMLMALVNTPIYGGSGGQVATFSMAPSANEIGIHEMGHTAFGLADEYEYYAGCGAEIGHDVHPAVEPAQPNVTIDSNRNSIKWHDLIAAATPMPTTQNANCGQCDPQPSPVPSGTVGAFEGAHYYHCQAYRPEFNCRMRALGFAFCAVCQNRIREVLSPFMPPPRLVDILRFVEIFQYVRPIDLVADPVPPDVIRLLSAGRPERISTEKIADDALSLMLSRIGEMETTELQMFTLKAKSSMMRLELAAKVAEAELARRGR